MAKILTAYFSATGVTAKAAKALAKAAGADLFEIAPVQKYTRTDLNWMDKASRSSVEMNDPAARPAIAGQVGDMAQYDTILLCFPVWWYREPRIIDTFLESYDLTGKKILLFATSGGSGLGRTAQEVRKLVPGAQVADGMMLNGGVDAKKLAALLK